MVEGGSQPRGRGVERQPRWRAEVNVTLNEAPVDVQPCGHGLEVATDLAGRSPHDTERVPRSERRCVIQAPQGSESNLRTRRASSREVRQPSPRALLRATCANHPSVVSGVQRRARVGRRARATTARTAQATTPDGTDAQPCGASGSAHSRPASSVMGGRWVQTPSEKSQRNPARHSLPATQAFSHRAVMPMGAAQRWPSAQSSPGRQGNPGGTVARCDLMHVERAASHWNPAGHCPAAHATEQ